MTYIAVREMNNISPEVRFAGSIAQEYHETGSFTTGLRGLTVYFLALGRALMETDDGTRDKCLDDTKAWIGAMLEHRQNDENDDSDWKDLEEVRSMALLLESQLRINIDEYIALNTRAEAGEETKDAG